MNSTLIQRTRRFLYLGRSLATVTLAVAFGLSANALAQTKSWTDLGGGLQGSNGVPIMSGYGSLYPGTTATFRVTQAAPNSTGIVSLSFAQSSTPFYGGIAQTLPPAWTSAIATDADGRGEAQLVVPAGTPDGLPIFVEAFVIDPAATQGIAITNAVRSFTLGASAFSDPALLYTSALNAAWQAQNEIGLDLYNLLASNASYYSAHAEATLDAITPADCAPASGDTTVGGGGGTGGGVAKGQDLEWKSLIGLKVGSAHIEVPWTSADCTSVLGDPTASGNLFAATFSAKLVGAKWPVTCTPTEPCPTRKRECGNYQITWICSILGVTFSSGSSAAETICSPCP